MKINDIVEFLGCSDDQVKFGGCDNPNNLLEIGGKYTVSDIEVHSWHTKIQLKGYTGKFNSVCFSEVTPTPTGLRELVKEKIKEAYMSGEDFNPETVTSFTDEILTAFRTYIEGRMPNKRRMVNPVPESDEVMGYNEALSETKKALLEGLEAL